MSEVPGPAPTPAPGPAATPGPSPSPAILHVDLDAFFASVEVLIDPELAGRPVVVGGTGTRGVVAAASYEARRYGVHSAMPTARARRLCPDGVFLPPRLGLYQEYSAAVFSVFGEFTPLVEGLSLDEAFLDVSGVTRLFGPGPEVAAQIRARVLERTDLVCSVGVAGTKLLAKLASAAAKPNGMLVVERDHELEFLHPLPVERLWGVGPATRARLDRLGVRTVGDLARVPECTLVSTIGDAHGRHLHALAWNRDDRPVEPDQQAKSVGAEETFARDIADAERARQEVARLADRVATRLRRSGSWARTVTIKVRFGDFRTITRSATLGAPTDRAGEVVGAAVALLAQVDVAEGVRLLGVSASGLEAPGARQETLPLDDSGDPGGGELDDVVDAVRQRFGDDAVGRASLLDRGRLRTGRGTEHSWGPDEGP